MFNRKLTLAIGALLLLSHPGEAADGIIGPDRRVRLNANNQGAQPVDFTVSISRTVVPKGGSIWWTLEAGGSIASIVGSRSNPVLALQARQSGGIRIRVDVLDSNGKLAKTDKVLVNGLPAPSGILDPGPTISVPAPSPGGIASVNVDSSAWIHLANVEDSAVTYRWTVQTPKVTIPSVASPLANISFPGGEGTYSVEFSMDVDRPGTTHIHRSSFWTFVVGGIPEPSSQLTIATSKVTVVGANATPINSLDRLVTISSSSSYPIGYKARVTFKRSDSFGAFHEIAYDSTGTLGGYGSLVLGVVGSTDDVTYVIESADYVLAPGGR